VTVAGAAAAGGRARGPLKCAGGDCNGGEGEGDGISSVQTLALLSRYCGPGEEY
jgi:hypothetical protein